MTNGPRGGEVWSYRAMSADSTLEGQRPLTDSTKTLSRMLQKAGYTTGMVGKWGLGAPNTQSIPTKMGFDFLWATIVSVRRIPSIPCISIKMDVRLHLDNDTVAPSTKMEKGADPYDLKSYDNYNLKTYSGDVMFDEMTGFINANNSQKTGHPFFMYWATPFRICPCRWPKKG